MLSLYKPDDYKRVLEAALLVANDPLPLSELKKLFDQDFDDETWRTLLDDLRRDWSGRTDPRRHAGAGQQPSAEDQPGCA